jgi:hypothetical protein
MDRGTTCGSRYNTLAGPAVDNGNTGMAIEGNISAVTAVYGTDCPQKVFFHP